MGEKEGWVFESHSHKNGTTYTQGNDFCIETFIRDQEALLEVKLRCTRALNQWRCTYGKSSYNLHMQVWMA